MSKCSQCLNSCSDALHTKCWPALKLLLTFTIPHDSRFNTAFSILSTFLAYISVLTLSFQVSNNWCLLLPIIIILVHTVMYVHYTFDPAECLPSGRTSVLCPQLHFWCILHNWSKWYSIRRYVHIYGNVRMRKRPPFSCSCVLSLYIVIDGLLARVVYVYMLHCTVWVRF